MQLLQKVFFCYRPLFHEKRAAETGCSSMYKVLLFHDLQDLHGTGLDADAAGDTLGGGSAFRSNHDLHGADLCALAAGGAELLVDHVHAGLGILRDGTGFANLGALSALDAGHGFGAVTLRHDADTGKIFIKGLVESGGAGADALQASHALRTLLNSQLLHSKQTLSFRNVTAIIQQPFKNSNDNLIQKQQISLFFLGKGFLRGDTIFEFSV